MPRSYETLEELLDRCKGGEQDAIAALVARFRDWAHHFATGILDDEALAEDAVQEAFAAALQQLDQLEEPRAFPGWLRQIIRRYAWRIAEKRREQPLLDVSHLISDRPSPLDVVTQEELRELVRRHIRNLPRAGREAAELFYLREMSCAGVALTLGIPEGTVKRRLHDARRQLRDQLFETLRDDVAPRPSAKDAVARSRVSWPAPRTPEAMTDPPVVRGRKGAH